MFAGGLAEIEQLLLRVAHEVRIVNINKGFVTKFPEKKKLSERLT